jgi:phage terminase large subunit-like protein
MINEAGKSTDEDKTAKHNKTIFEEIEVAGSQVIDQVKAIINEGNVRRIKLSDQDGDFAVELPMTMGVIAGGAIVLAAPWLAILGVVAGMITKVKIVVERGAANAPAEEAAKPVDPPVD